MHPVCHGRPANARPEPDADVPLVLTRHALAGPGRRRSTGLTDAYLVLVPSHGRCEVRYDRVEFGIDRDHWAVVSPAAPFALAWAEDCTLLELRIGRPIVDEVGADIVHPGVAPPYEIEPQLRAHGAAGRGLAGLLSLLDAGAGHGRAPEGNSATRARLGAALVSLLIEVHGLRQPPPSAPGRISRRVVRALQFMRENAGIPLTVADIASATGTSIRTLNHAFRRDLGTTPSRELRRLRLHAARAELLGRGPERCSVTAAATRWGFDHLGRFASAYRSCFGELPSVTLARRLSPSLAGGGASGVRGAGP